LFPPEQIQGWLEAIQAAIMSGTNRVSYDGKAVEYRSISELYLVRDDLLRQLGLVAPVRRTVASYDGGF
jgi:hypothetical protein